MHKMKPIRILQFSPNCPNPPSSSLLTVTPLKSSGFTHEVPSSTAISSRNSIEDDSQRKSKGKDNDNKNSKCKGHGKQKDKEKIKCKVRQKYCFSDDMMGVFALQKGGGSEELLKKTQICQLRELIKSAKWAIGLAQENEDNLQQKICSIKKEMKRTFDQLHRSLKQRQLNLYDEVEVKLIQMKQKYHTKTLQTNYLQNYVRKCQQDINTNYQSIIKDLSYQQLSQIVCQYTHQIQTYINHIQTQLTLKFYTPLNGQSCNFANDFKLSFEEDFPQNQFENAFDKQNICSNLIQLKSNVNKNGQKSLQKHTKNMQSNFEQSESHNTNKMKMKKMIGSQPKIWSARGKY